MIWHLSAHNMQSSIQVSEKQELDGITETHEKRKHPALPFSPATLLSRRKKGFWRRSVADKGTENKECKGTENKQKTCDMWKQMCLKQNQKVREERPVQ